MNLIKRMESNRKANLFIVGAMKAGTTSFCDTISDHPDIFFSPIKEPNFFVSTLPSHIFKESPYFSIDQYFQKEYPAQLHIAHLRSEKYYSKLFELANGEKYLAEGSTAYFHAPESASLIHEYNPDAKIIILLRDGIKRAFSHYKMDIGLGKTINSFDEVLQKDINERQQGIESNWDYVGMSLYDQNIKRFKKYFGNNVLVLNFDDLISNQENQFNKLFEFLNIANVLLRLKKTNESANIRFKKGLYFLKQSGLKDMLSNILPQKFRHRIFKSLKKKEQLQMSLSPELHDQIEKLFKEDQIKMKAEC